MQSRRELQSHGEYSTVKNENESSEIPEKSSIENSEKVKIVISKLHSEERESENPSSVERIILCVVITIAFPYRVKSKCLIQKLSAS